MEDKEMSLFFRGGVPAPGGAKPPSASVHGGEAAAEPPCHVGLIPLVGLLTFFIFQKISYFTKFRIVFLLDLLDFLPFLDFKRFLTLQSLELF